MMEGADTVDELLASYLEYLELPGRDETREVELPSPVVAPMMGASSLLLTPELDCYSDLPWEHGSGAGDAGRSPGLVASPVLGRFDRGGATDRSMGLSPSLLGIYLDFQTPDREATKWGVATTPSPLKQEGGGGDINHLVSVLWCSDDDLNDIPGWSSSDDALAVESRSYEISSENSNGFSQNEDDDDDDDDDVSSQESDQEFFSSEDSLGWDNSTASDFGTPLHHAQTIFESSFSGGDLEAPSSSGGEASPSVTPWELSHLYNRGHDSVPGSDFGGVSPDPSSGNGKKESVKRVVVNKKPMKTPSSKNAPPDGAANPRGRPRGSTKVGAQPKKTQSKPPPVSNPARNPRSMENTAWPRERRSHWSPSQRESEGGSVMEDHNSRPNQLVGGKHPEVAVVVERYLFESSSVLRIQAPELGRQSEAEKPRQCRAATSTSTSTYSTIDAPPLIPDLPQTQLEEIMPELSNRELNKLINRCSLADPEGFLESVRELPAKVQLKVYRMIAWEAKSPLITNRVIWHKSEDEILARMMVGSGDRVNWVEMSNNLANTHKAIHGFEVRPRKSNRHCHQRWSRVLKQKISREGRRGSFPGKRQWTQAEDDELLNIVLGTLHSRELPLDPKSIRGRISWSNVAHRHSSTDLSDVSCRMRFMRLTNIK